MKILIILEILIFNLIFSSGEQVKFTPDWNSLDNRTLPQWYDDAKIGIFIHWGVFSVPSFKSEWFWWYLNGTSPQPDVVAFMKDNYPPGTTYADFAKDFTAQFFDPDQWADLIKASGAKYVVLTTKHHEGFCMWPSANSWNWNSMDIGPRRDIVGDLANSIRSRTNVTFGLYHSLFEWFNPLFLNDEASGYKTQTFVDTKTIPELYDLIHRYKPEIVWSDGEWGGSDDYWKTKEFLAWLFNESPVKNTVVVNDRWGANDICHHGSFYTCDDRYNPGKILNHKWENCMTLDYQSWGYRRNMKLTDIITIEDLITQVVETVSCGGNILINIGPTKDGIIVPIFEERLRQLGSWLNINGEAIYSSRPWKYQNDTTNSDVWYTSNEKVVYAILLKYPQDSGKVKLTSPNVTETTSISLLGYSGKLNWSPLADGGLVIDLLTIDYSKCLSKWAWTFKLTNIFDS